MVWQRNFCFSLSMGTLSDPKEMEDVSKTQTMGRAAFQELCLTYELSSADSVARGTDLGPV